MKKNQREQLFDTVYRKPVLKITGIVIFMLISMIFLGGTIEAGAKTKEKKYVKSMTVSRSSMKVTVGEKGTIRYSVKVKKGASKKITVKISDKKIVSVKKTDKKMVFTGKKEGSATVKVTTKGTNKSGKKISRRISVNVTEISDSETGSGGTSKSQGQYSEKDESGDESDDSDEASDGRGQSGSVADGTVKGDNNQGAEDSSDKNNGKETQSDTDKDDAKETKDNAGSTENQNTNSKSGETVTGKEKEETVPQVQYQAHTANKGWGSYVKDGETAGTTNEARQLEAFRMNLTDENGTSMVRYKVHAANIGWLDWVESGEVAGTTGESRQVEAIAVELTGSYAEKYDIYYRVHLRDIGWLDWAKNGEVAGSTGMSIRMEAIQIKIVKKGEYFNAGSRHELIRPTLTYQAHVGNVGWQSTVDESKVAGTTGQSKQMEAIKIYLNDFNGKSAIQYQAHVEDEGWQTWKSSGEEAGTTGKSKHMEAIKISPTASFSAFFDVYYRVHVANIGWLGWAKNGEIAGTTGGRRQVEAIQIFFANKGASFDRGGAAYRQLTENNTAVVKTVDDTWKTWKQGDSPWSGKIIKTKTMAKGGCRVTSMAMLLCKSGKKTASTFNPGNALDLFKSVGVVNGNGDMCERNIEKAVSGFRYAGERSLSAVSRQDTINYIKSLYTQGYYCELLVNKGGHAVALDSVVGNTIYIVDPGYGSRCAFDVYSRYSSGISHVFYFKG